MPAFHLLLEDDGSGGSTRMDFEAESRDYALIIAQGYAGGRNVELWEGASMLGSLHKAAPQLWKLS